MKSCDLSRLSGKNRVNSECDWRLKTRLKLVVLIRVACLIVYSGGAEMLNRSMPAWVLLLAIASGAWAQTPAPAKVTAPVPPAVPPAKVAVPPPAVAVPVSTVQRQLVKRQQA